MNLQNICGDCGWVASQYNYTYDEKGFIVAGTAIESLAGHIYDDAGKLLSATETEDKYSTYVYTFEYDLMGNRTAVIKTNESGTVVESEKYVYNESYQLVSVELYDEYNYTVNGALQSLFIGKKG